MAAKMTRLFTTVCVIALTVGAQAKPVQLGLIDNRWVIEYDAELFAGACIATMDSNLLKLKISFITAYPKEGQKNFGSLVFLVQSGLGLSLAQLTTLPLIPKGEVAKQRNGPLFLTGGQMDLCLHKQTLT
jgi:hypothetical protein